MILTSELMIFAFIVWCPTRPKAQLTDTLSIAGLRFLAPISYGVLKSRFEVTK